MSITRIGSILLLAASLLLTTACERTQTTQLGYRGLGLMQVAKPSVLAALAEKNQVPKPLKPGKVDGPRAGEFYENVQVLGDYSKSEFARTMASFKNWVAPEQGCGYCHNAPNYADDSKYPKRVAREMIRMTRHINSDWKKHVAETGVTCYTCHRGNPVPAKIWYSPPPPRMDGFVATSSPMKLPTPTASMTGLPNDALSSFLLDSREIRVVGTSALQNGNRRSIKQAKLTYSMMLVMAESLGVNCDYCHNTRAFYSWEQSRPQRATAWYGIRMARDLNNAYMVPLTATFPPERLGPTGDAPKIYCATCHQGVYKPLYGVSMVHDFPELIAPKTADYVGGPPKADPAADAPNAAPDPAAEAPAGGGPAVPAQKTIQLDALSAKHASR
jgi:photosynthetic reaction center cytochrome c subunit